MINMNSNSKRSLINGESLNRLLASVSQKEIKTILSFYYNLLDGKFQESVMQTEDEWLFIPMTIDPFAKKVGEDLLVGCEIIIGFYSKFQSKPLVSYAITNWNRFSESNPCSFIGEIRKPLLEDYVPDEKLGELKLQERKSFSAFKEIIEHVWVNQVLKPIKNSSGSPPPESEVESEESQDPVQYEARYQPPIISSPVMNVMAPTKPAVLKLQGGIAELPQIGKKQMDNRGENAKQEVHQIEQEDEKETVESEKQDDDDDDIEFNLDSMIPDLDDDDDTQTPLLDLEMMKGRK